MSMKFKLFSLCSSLSLIILLMFLVTWHSTTAQKDDGLVINLAGRQRMLSQKLTKEILEFEVAKKEKGDTKKLAATVKNTMEVFSRTLIALKDSGEAPLGLNMADTTYRNCPKSEEPAYSQLVKVDTIWQEFKTKVSKVLTNSDDSAASLAWVIQNNIPLLKEMNKAVGMMQQQSENKISVLLTIQFIGVVLGAILMATALLSIVMILRQLGKDPKVLSTMVRKVSQGELDLPREQGTATGVYSDILSMEDTIRALQSEMNRLSCAAEQGDLSVRGDASAFSGEYAELVLGINRMLDAIVLPIKEAGRVLAQVSVGEIDELIEQSYEGDHEQMKEAVNNVATTLQSLRNEMQLLIQAATNGNMSERSDVSNFQGSYKDIIQGVNDMLDAVVLPINEGNRVLNKISRGNLSEEITLEMKGDHDSMKQAVNGVRNWLLHLIDYVTKMAHGDQSAEIAKSSDEDQVHEWLVLLKSNILLLVNDVNTLAEAGARGDLNVRADAAKHNGSYRDVIEGVNTLMDAVVLPLNESAEVLSAVAQNDLTVKIKGDFQGNLGELKNSVNNMIGTLNGTLGEVSDAVATVKAGVSGIMDASQSLAQGATEQAASLEEISSSMTEMSSQIKSNAEHVSDANNLAESVRKTAADGSSKMEEMMTAMTAINESSSQIAKIIKVIDDIAFQTNLLALNAAVEAARAGQHGKGFAVVADEVRSLAGRSAKAAQETSALIESSSEKVAAGFKSATNATASFTQIQEGIEKTTVIMAEISRASQEQATGASQISIGIAQLDDVTQQSAAISEETSSSAVTLDQQAGQLSQELSRFILTNSTQLKKIAPSAEELPLPKSPEPSTPSDGWGGVATTKEDDCINLDDDEFGRF